MLKLGCCDMWTVSAFNLVCCNMEDILTSSVTLEDSFDSSTT